mmetsp:Transcript_13686/g.26270  ORF Transcript_13686/g.26270 Transcript_13686/m.26270 type:complete len:332 (-) Transcript_13686:42-1037(-)
MDARESESESSNTLELISQALENAEDGGYPWVVEHTDVTCDSCECEPITGQRWKCVTCTDRDLCSTCYLGLDAGRANMDSLSEAVKSVVPCLRHSFARVQGPERQVVLHEMAQEDNVTKFPDGIVSEFLRTFPIDSIPCSMLAWVGRSLVPPSDVLDQVSLALEDWDALLGRRKPTATDVDEIARRHNLTEGKWCLFPHRKTADAVWQAIARSLPEIKGATAAKVSTISPEKSTHAVCVYTENYLDQANVETVRSGIRQQIGIANPDIGFSGRMVYKPDIYTYLGIYAGNAFNMRPSVYTCNQGVQASATRRPDHNSHAHIGTSRRKNPQH